MRRWRKSRWFLLRVLGDALKASTTMMYISHPRVLEHIEEYRVCEHETDGLRVPVRPKALEAPSVSE